MLEQLRQDAAAEGLDIRVEKLDVTCRDNVKEVAAKLDRVDVLFNCAGYKALRIHASQLARLLWSSSWLAIVENIADDSFAALIINVFSYVHQGSIFECNDDVFQRSWDINVRSMFWMVQVWIQDVITV